MERGRILGLVFSIVGGALILACGINSIYWTLTSFEGILDFLSSFLPPVAVEFWRDLGPLALATWYLIFGVVFGILVILGGVCGGLLRKGGVKAWGITTIILSLLSIFSGGGYYIGLILGIIGGTLLLTTK